MARKSEPSEHQIQAAFVQWCRLSESRYPALKLAFAVPNGGWRNIVTAERLKREGCRAGVPDWILPTGEPWYGLSDRQFLQPMKMGLAIEFKKPGGRMTRDQKNWASLARQYGWRVEICTSSEQAIAIVKEYLS